MKKILLVVIPIISLMVVSGCATKNDLDEVRDEQSSIKERLSILEKWQQNVNSSIVSLQNLIAALEAKDYVTSVSPLADASGYVINFEKSGAVTIKNGINGQTPIIGTRQDTDGKYYWTLNGDWLFADNEKIKVNGDDGITPHIGENGNWWIGLVDTGVLAKGENGTDGFTPYVGENGNWWVSSSDLGVLARGVDGLDGLTPYIGNNGNWWIGASDMGVSATVNNGMTPYIGENGNWWIGTRDLEEKAVGIDGKDAVAPKLRINANNGEWEISVDNGVSWDSTGVVAQGDAIFALDGIDNSNLFYVDLTLADGVTKIRLQRYMGLKIGDSSAEQLIECNSDNITLPIVLPENFKEEDFVAIMVKLNTNNGIITNIRSKTINDNSWDIEVCPPEFGENGKCTNGGSITITTLSAIYDAEIVMLEVIVACKDGEKMEAVRAIKFLPDIK